MKQTLFFLALVVSLAFAPEAFACSVAEGWPPSVAANLAEKDAMFIGTVTGISQDKSIYGEYRISFEVDETYKGSLEDTITVRSQSSSAACGYDDGYGTFKQGTVWVIYLDGNTTDGYHTDSISLNTKYASVAKAKAALAAEGLTPKDDDGPIMCTLEYAPVCGKSPDGTTKTYGNSCALNADKAEFLYQGECKNSDALPKRDLTVGARGQDVTWLQQFLMSKIIGPAARALEAVGATGYFGTLTRAALAEYQSAHGITPAKGYFGPKTRAYISGSSSTITETFSGKITAVNTGCFADGICSVTIGDKEVILLTGMRIGTIPPVGALKGVESIGDLEGKIGATATVYAAKTTEGTADYTLYGSTTYYVEVGK